MIQNSIKLISLFIFIGAVVILIGFYSQNKNLIKFNKIILKGNNHLSSESFYKIIDYDIDNSNLESFYLSINKYLDVKREDLHVDYAGIRPKPFAAHEVPMDFVIKNEAASGFPNFINLVGIESPGLTSSLSIGKYVVSILRN